MNGGGAPHGAADSDAGAELRPKTIRRTPRGAPGPILDPLNDVELCLRVLLPEPEGCGITLPCVCPAGGRRIYTYPPLGSGNLYLASTQTRRIPEIGGGKNT